MKRVYILLLLIFCLTAALAAEEGFWTFDNPPTRYLQEKYDFTLTLEWLDHIRLSSLRFNTGGSASFVSADGLVLTNFHVGMGLVQDLSTPENDYVAAGFLAENREQEIPAKDLEVNLLLSISDVTDRVKRAGSTAEGDPAKIKELRKAEMARIEKEENEKTGLRCDVITLYNGGQYKLYRYRKYTDVRLVFTPPVSTVFFGGIHDNYTYPRYSLDFALFRIYEDGKPLKPEHYLKVNPDGAKENELVFISGNPGNTERLSTVAQFEFDRDYWLPLRLRFYNKQKAEVYDYMSRGAEATRQAVDDINGVENLWKRYTGFHTGLLDTSLFNRHVRKEQEIRTGVQADSDRQERFGSAWDNIAAVYEDYKLFYKTHYFAAKVFPRLGILGKAGTIVQLVAELQKPNEERLEDYRDSNLESLKLKLFSPAPVYLEKDEVRLAAALETMLEELSPADPLAEVILQGKSPRDVAQIAVSNTKLDDPDFRRQLVAGGLPAVEKSDDSMIALARRADPIMRQYVKRYEDEVESVVELNGSLIAEAIFELSGPEVPPDANFTLRIGLGVAKGYPYNGTLAPYKTTLYGMFDRAASFDDRIPFALPESIAAKKDVLDMSTPFNSVLTVDSVGGNSGSPIVNTNGELIGLAFDGNLEKIVVTYVYTEEKGRSVAVHPAIMIEMLSKVYQADDLVNELLGKK